MVGDEEAQHQGQLAAISKVDEYEGAVRPKQQDFAFPPWPPGLDASSVWATQLAGEIPIGEDTQEEGLLMFLRKGLKRNAKGCGDPERRGDKAARGDEGRGRKTGEDVKGRRIDLPRPRPNRLDGPTSLKHKWKTAIQTARNFRMNKNKKDSAMSEFRKEYYANSSRRARASIRKTVEKILENLGAKERGQLWSCNTMEQLGTVLRDSDYKAGVAYLNEYKHMLIESGTSWSQLLQKTYAQVARAINRAKGPAKKAAEVEEGRWLEACSKETNEMAEGTVHRPALMFAVATVWMLREVELAAIHKEDILIDEKEKLVSLTLRLTKTDQEGRGLRRTLQCCCKSECGWLETCPFMITRTALDHIPIE